MTERHLNIVSLDNPYPPDYGGMIDVYNRIRCLKSSGVNVHLHCFEYGRAPNSKLDSLCESVDYYPRTSNFYNLLSRKPYNVVTRRSDKLLKNICKNDFPILFEGLHTTFHFGNPALGNRKKYIRAHNIEHTYYESLASMERNIVKASFFKIEAAKFKRYEDVMRDADRIFTISKCEQEYYDKRYGNATLLPPFHDYDTITVQPGEGKHILFTANLAVVENVKIAERLIKEVFSKVRYECIIAGRNPSNDLIAKANEHGNIRIVANPTDVEMQRLFRDAHICIVHSIINNGFKIKLLSALFSSRHCIADDTILSGSALNEICHSANTSEQEIEEIERLMKRPFFETEMAEREEVLRREYSNATAVNTLITTML